MKKGYTARVPPFDRISTDRTSYLCVTSSDKFYWL